MADFSRLTIEGRLVQPADAGWEEARRAWNLAADQRPAAVAIVAGTDDVAATVAFAAANGLRVAPQGTGHGAGPLASLEDAILLKTERLRGIEIDAGRRLARVEAGVLAAELSRAAGAHGLCSMPGSSPDVGVVGYTLGGGLSWLARRHGFACNHVRSIELVGADGERRTVDSEHDPDLFWALRGGGGGYAVVTAMELELQPLAEVYGGALAFAAEVGADGLRAYRDWATAQPDEVTSTVRFLTPPPIPDVPEPIRGKPLLVVDAVCIGTLEEGEAAVAPLREIGEPILDSFEWRRSSELGGIHMDPEAPVPGIGRGGLIAGLPAEAIEAFVAVAGPQSGSPLLLTELRHLGGALARPAAGGGALDRLDAAFTLYGVGMPASPELAAAIPAHLERIEAEMGPWLASGSYLNFTEQPCDVDAILPAETCAKLAAAKRRWDPDDRILANHAVATGGPA